VNVISGDLTVLLLASSHRGRSLREARRSGEFGHVQTRVMYSSAGCVDTLCAHNHHPHGYHNHHPHGHHNHHPHGHHNHHHGGPGQHVQGLRPTAPIIMTPVLEG
jgi:hypothetical protein